jgi:signal peptide peptidase SppA
MVITGSTAVIPVRGVIAQYADQVNGACQDTGRSAQQLQSDLKAALASGQVQRVILQINSPGGTVAGTQETADLIRAVSVAGKPVTAYVDGMAASAAYWLASQADEIVASSSTAEVGSIGVLTAFVDSTRADEAAGYKTTVIRSAALKAPGAYGEQVDSQQVASMQRLVNDMHAAFADAVAAGRGLTAEQTAKAATGELFTARTALGLGLIDRIASLDALLAEVDPAASPVPISSPAPAMSASASANTPTAAAVAESESCMDAATLAALTALSNSHPEHAAALVGAAAKPGATASDLHQVVAAATAKAKDDQILALTAKVSDLEASLAAERTAKATADAEAAKAKGFAAGFPTDPGPAEPTAATITGEQFMALTPDQRNAFRSRGGVVKHG